MVYGLMNISPRQCASGFFMQCRQLLDLKKTEQAFGLEFYLM